ncbi:MAG: hypothetical protein ACYTGX_11790 [Planctomycetota bacterium]|jgi:hypothetical protein
MKLRLLFSGACLAAVCTASGCLTPEPKIIERTRLVHDAPELRAALVRLGFTAADADGAAPAVLFGDVAPPVGDELILAWTLDAASGPHRAAIAVHRLDEREAAVRGILYDAAGDDFAGTPGSSVELRDVDGDYRTDIVVLRRVADAQQLTIYAVKGESLVPVARVQGSRLEVRDLDGDRRCEVLVSREVAKGLRGFPEILQLTETGLQPAAKRYEAVMPEQAKAYAAHVREATQDAEERRAALAAAARYLTGIGYPTEAAQLEQAAAHAASGTPASSASPAPEDDSEEASAVAKG